MRVLEHVYVEGARFTPVAALNWTTIGFCGLTVDAVTKRKNLARSFSSILPTLIFKKSKTRCWSLLMTSSLCFIIRSTFSFDGDRSSYNFWIFSKVSWLETSCMCDSMRPSFIHCKRTIGLNRNSDLAISMICTFRWSKESAGGQVIPKRVYIVHRLSICTANGCLLSSVVTRCKISLSNWLI